MLLFTAKTLLPVVAFIQKNNADLLLVKDEGIYVMSSIEKVKKETKRTVAYAEGFDPNVFADGGELYDACVAAVGGDDFAESIKLSDVVLDALARGHHDLHIYVTPTQIRIELEPAGETA
ncbi:DUF3085 domain-containing protein [Cedecea davisae]|uniref:DUF3085 domain-containing protein n=1 Tax=Cedecea davisae TaxID=158484 RepID=UPI00242CD769|nr:DUF3085 domain-containing protein [Cedecea davisae]